MKKPNLVDIIKNNSDKTGHIPVPGNLRLRQQEPPQQYNPYLEMFGERGDSQYAPTFIGAHAGVPVSNNSGVTFGYNTLRSPYMDPRSGFNVGYEYTGPKGNQTSFNVGRSGQGQTTVGARIGFKNGGDISIPNLQEGNWLNRYTSGGIYLSDRAKATQFGQYAKGGPVDTPESLSKKAKPIEGPNDQKAWLVSYIKSPMYRERLKKEFPDQNNAFITNEVNERLNNVLNEKVDYVNSIAKEPGFISGMTIPKQYDGEWYDYKQDKFLPGKWGPDPYGRGHDKPGHVYLENEYRPNAWDPTQGYETTPLHEFGHAADDGGVRIPTSTKKKIFNYTKSDASAPNYRSQGMTFDYYNTPTEFINRIQPIRYLLDKNNIYDAKTNVFGEKEYNKMFKNSEIIKNVHFQDVMNTLKGTAEQKKAAFIDIMNSVAQNEQPQNSNMQYAKEGVVVTTDTTLPQTDLEIPKIINQPSSTYVKPPINTIAPGTAMLREDEMDFFNKNANEGKQFINDWMNSPRYKEMLAASINADDPVGYNKSIINYYAKKRSDALNSAYAYPVEAHYLDGHTNVPSGGVAGDEYNNYAKNWSSIITNPSALFGNGINRNSDKSNAYRQAFVHKLDGRPRVRVDYPVTYGSGWYQPEEFQGIFSHEYSHASDLAGNLIPYGDQQKMQKYASQNNKKGLNEFQTYVAEPTETRARLNNLRQIFNNNKKLFDFDPFTQKIDLNTLKKAQKYYISNDGNKTLNQPLGDLRKVYTDEQIVDLLNSVSKNETKSSKNADVARYGGMFENGGSLNKYAPGGVTCPPGFSPKPPYNGCFNAQGQTPEQVQAEVGKKGIFNAITNPGGVRPDLSSSVSASITTQTTQSPLTKNTISNKPSSDGIGVGINKSYANNTVRELEKTRPAIEAYMKQWGVDYNTASKAVSMGSSTQGNNKNAQITQGKAFDTQADIERRKSLNQAYIGTNQNATVNDKGYVVPKYADTDLQGNIIDSQANRQRRISGVVGGLAAPLVGAASVLGAGEIAAAATPLMEATSAAMGTNIAGISGLTANNALTAYTGYKGIQSIPHLAHSYEEVYHDPTDWKNWGNAAAQTLNTGLSLYPLASEVKAGINTYKGLNHIKEAEGIGKAVFDKGLEHSLEETSHLLKPVEEITPVLNTPVLATPGPKSKKTFPTGTAIPAHKYGGSTRGWLDKFALAGQVTTQTTSNPNAFNFNMPPIISGTDTTSTRIDTGKGYAQLGNVGYQTNKPFQINTPTDKLISQVRQVKGNAFRVFPINVGNYLTDLAENVTGVKGGNMSINNDDLSDEEKIVLWNTTMNAVKRNKGAITGGADYKDYPTTTGKNVKNFMHHNPNQLVKDVTDPEGRMASTIGGYTYTLDPNTGNYIITDTYNFTNARDKTRENVADDGSLAFKMRKFADKGNSSIKSDSFAGSDPNRRVGIILNAKEMQRLIASKNKKKYGGQTNGWIDKHL